MTVFKKSILALLAALVFPYTGWAQQALRSEVVARIDEAVQETMARDHIVGVSIGIMKNGHVVLAKGYGYADLENDVPATEHTVYRLGSVTKQFTAAAIMMLVEQGALRLEDDLTTYLPDYPTQGHTITIERLLNHTSGIKGYTEMGRAFGEVIRLDLSHEELIDLFSAEPFEFAPGHKYQYNNSAYYLLGVIIERVTGQPYAQFLQDTIWEPLGMSSSYYLDNRPIIKHRAEGYEVRNGIVVNDDPISMKLPYAAGSLGSDVMDLLTWQQALVEHRLLSEVSYQKMTTPGTLNDGSEITYGFGLALSEMKGHRKIEHGGGINGFRTQLSYYPDDDLTVAVLCNTGAANPAVLESRIAHLVLDLPETVDEEIDLTEEDLQVYAGTYHPGRSPLRLAVQNGTLTFFGQRLRPIGGHVFVSTIDTDQRFIFEVEGDRAVHLTIEREGRLTRAPRVD